MKNAWSRPTSKPAPVAGRSPVLGTALGWVGLVVAIAPAVGCPDRWGQQGRQRIVVELVPVEAHPAKDDLAVITEPEYRRELARLRLEGEGTPTPLSKELKTAILGRMIDRRLLLLEATHKGVRASTTAVARELEAMKRGLPDKSFEQQLINTYQTEHDLVRAIEERLTTALLLKQEALSHVAIVEEEARRLWDSMPETEKVHPARVHAAQIVLRTEEEGKAVIDELHKGGAFAELAKRTSIAPESVRGGELGWFEAGVMPTVFDDVCFALEPGAVSELTASEYGFHIFKVLEAEAERAMTYEEAKPQLLDRLREERGRSAEAGYLEQLRARVRIIRNEDVIASIE